MNTITETPQTAPLASSSDVPPQLPTQNCTPLGPPSDNEWKNLMPPPVKENLSPLHQFMQMMQQMLTLLSRMFSSLQVNQSVPKLSVGATSQTQSAAATASTTQSGSPEQMRTSSTVPATAAPLANLAPTKVGSSSSLDANQSTASAPTGSVAFPPDILKNFIEMFRAFANELKEKFGLPIAMDTFVNELLTKFGLGGTTDAAAEEKAKLKAERKRATLRKRMKAFMQKMRERLKEAQLQR